MSPVDFKKWPCGPVDFKGQGPQVWGSIWTLLSELANITFFPRLFGLWDSYGLSVGAVSLKKSIKSIV